jgi:lipoprotein-anchoring transpeptidase ErfK/SrfK
MISRVFLSLIPLVLGAVPAAAQGWWWDTAPRDRGYREYRERSYGYPPGYSYRSPPSYGYGRGYDRYEDDEDDFDEPRPQRQARPFPKLMDGGGRPAVQPIAPQSVAYESRHPAGTIIIDTAGRQLLLIQQGGTALRYPISVGREGFTWTGTEKVSRIAAWPDWHPPAEMRERDPKLPEKMTGGVKNPLGAKAIYLGNTLYRIHGTNDAKSIGRAASSGCFRMLNGHVVDLAERVQIGAAVVVVPNLRAAEAIPAISRPPARQGS